MANRRFWSQVAAGAVPPTLPPSVEEAYRKKCIELKRRMNEVEANNDAIRLRKTRLLRGIRKMRLERSILLHELGKRMRKNGADGHWDDDSEGSSEGPPTREPIEQPNDKPLRSKRSHRRHAPTPPPLAHQLSGPNPSQYQHQMANFQPPYQPQQQSPYSVGAIANGVSHIPAASAHQGVFPSNGSYGPSEPQPQFPQSTFEFFVQHFFERQVARGDAPNREELLHMAQQRWEGLGQHDHEEWENSFRQHWAAYVDRQRVGVHYGVVHSHGGGNDEQEVDEDREETERHRERYEERVQEDEGADTEEGAAARGDFTAVNG